MSDAGDIPRQFKVAKQPKLISEHTGVKEFDFESVAWFNKKKG